MKHWSPDRATPKPDEGQARDAWVEWLTHAPLHGTVPDRHERGGGASFFVLTMVALFWIGLAWAIFGR